MDLYNVIISPKALDQLNGYIDYLLNTLFNEQAAKSVWEDAIETGNRLQTVAGSLKLCSHPQLKALGYRVIHFRHHAYLMLYRIAGSDVYVEAIYHQLQDFENTFINF